MNNKLDFLMTLTETKNSVLSKSVSFDPSYISRIRSGSRTMPRTSQFTGPVAAYFSRNIRTASQKLLLAQEICPGQMLPDNPEELQNLIHDWLVADEAPAPDAVGGFLRHFSSMFFRTDLKPSLLPSRMPDELKARIEAMEEQYGGMDYFYGNAGKLTAVELFLGRLCLSGKPHELLLFSDEEMTWLYEDQGFTSRWAAMLLYLLSTGSTIQIPHFITRSKTEMFEACRNWIPLYMTGSINPWYCPIPRDGVLKRSLFVAAGHSALISSSVGDSTADMLNIMVTDKKAVSALAAEHRNYMKLCRPLMHIHNARDIPGYMRSISSFEQEKGDLLAAQPIPSFFAFPHSVVQEVAERCSLPELVSRHQKACAAFRTAMKSGNRHTDIVHLPDPEKVRKGEMLFPMCDLFGCPDLVITPEDLSRQLISTIRLLAKEPSYSVILSDRIPENILLYTRKDGDSLLSSAQPASIAFAITQKDMSASMWDYLSTVIESEGSASREKTMRTLRTYIRLLRN